MEKKSKRNKKKRKDKAHIIKEEVNKTLKELP
jgi:hypothetical protein